MLQVFLLSFFPDSFFRMMTYSADQEFAIEQDRADGLRGMRERFHIPIGTDGQPLIYFVGNSLGLMPKTTRIVPSESIAAARTAVTLAPSPAVAASYPS